MKKLKVAFLWHMHQPYYLDEKRHTFALPWVRLHSTRGYYDMLKILDNHPDIRVNFNLAPTLLLQIEKYFDVNNKDKYYELSLKHPKDLNYEEKLFILSKFFMVNYATVISKHPRYNDLLNKRGYQTNRELLKEAIKIYTTQDFLDLQVWFNLGWFGFSLVDEEPLIRELIKKGRNFTQQDKEELLKLQLNVLQRIIPLYKKYQDEGKIEISGSPFYHPILPLLYDNRLALECMPNVKLPSPIFSYPEEADSQIVKAKKYYEEKFKKQLNGMWPSEGSVSNEIIRLMAQQNIKWCATDEEILFNSVGAVTDRSRTLYKPYKMNFDGYEISLFFRDHIFSDNIGFRYAKLNGTDAAQDLYTHLKNIFNYLKNDNNDYIVSIVLDGENPWEYYNDSGKEFLNTIYTKIEEDENLESVTFSEYIEKYQNAGKLTSIFTGSWINHNFDIWIGGVEENKAWSLLSKTKQFLENFINQNPNFDKEKLMTAQEELYQAEGSDWFWWYGDQFSTENDEEFDALFRSHLKNVYYGLDSNPPEELNIPICEKSKALNLVQPSGVLDPIIDGSENSYFEWWEAVKYKPPTGTTMARSSKGPIKMLYYGFNDKKLFFRLDFTDKDKILTQDIYKLKINFIRPERNRIIFTLSKDCNEYHIISAKEEREINRLNEIKINEIVELAIPFSELNLNYKDDAYFFIEVIKKEKVVEVLPTDGNIYFKVPPKNFKSLMWLE